MSEPHFHPDSQSLTTRVMARVHEAGSSNARSLRRVFLDMGDSYRDYRRRTGEPVSPAVRGAANRFRKHQDIPNLVAVAASLDALDVLTW